MTADDGGLQRTVRSVASLYEVLGLAATLWFLGKFIRYAFPPLFETFQVEYAISTTAIGIAFSGFMFLYALMQFPSGALADRLGARRVITVGALVAGVGAVIIAIRPPLALFVLGMVVIGAGTGAHKTVAVRLLSVTYPGRFGRTLGVFDTIGASGGVVAPVSVAAIFGVAALTWRSLFAATAIAFVTFGLVFFVRLGRPAVGALDGATTDSVIPWRAYRATFSRPKVVAFVAMTILTAVAYNGLVAFLPLALATEGGFEPATASLVYSLLFVASLAQLATGEATDRAGPLRIAGASLLVATVGLALLVGLLASPVDLTAAPGLALSGLVVLLVGAGAHGYRPARDVYIVSVVPAATAGGSLGVVRTILMLAGATSPAAVGVVADRLDFVVAFAGLAVTAGLAVGMVALVMVLERADPIQERASS